MQYIIFFIRGETNVDEEGNDQRFQVVRTPTRVSGEEEASYAHINSTWSVSFEESFGQDKKTRTKEPSKPFTCICHRRRLWDFFFYELQASA